MSQINHSSRMLVITVFLLLFRFLNSSQENYVRSTILRSFYYYYGIIFVTNINLD